MKRTSISLKRLVLSCMAMAFVFANVTMVAGYDRGYSSDRCVQGGPWTPTSDIGQRHIIMAQEAPYSCSVCHNVLTMYTGNQLLNLHGTPFAKNMAVPDLTLFDHVDMEAPTPCIECHCDNLFTSQMGNGQYRCSACHPIGQSYNQGR
jgi:hypothetical protein